MKPEEKQLHHLNFKQVLDYTNPPPHKHRFVPEDVECTGFCCDCEHKGLAQERYGSEEILMSHGCTMHDFVSTIGRPLPVDPEKMCSRPVMFLLENPGGDYGLGKGLQCKGVTKKPPVMELYFSSEKTSWPQTSWPECLEDIENPYGDYFAYLMARHGLSNVYITNCVKCKYSGDKKDPNGQYFKTAWNCMERFLKQELEIFQPALVVCFGRQVSDKLVWPVFERNKVCTFRKVRLLHPAARIRRAELIERNDKSLEAAIKNCMKSSDLP